MRKVKGRHTSAFIDCQFNPSSCCALSHEKQTSNASKDLSIETFSGHLISTSSAKKASCSEGWKDRYGMLRWCWCDIFGNVLQKINFISVCRESTQWLCVNDGNEARASWGRSKTGFSALTVFLPPREPFKASTALDGAWSMHNTTHYSSFPLPSHAPPREIIHALKLFTRWVWLAQMVSKSSKLL